VILHRENNVTRSEYLQRGGSSKPGVVSGTGLWTINQLRSLLGFINLWVAVMVQGVRPLNWRRTVRLAFVQRCFLIGVRALPLTLLTGGIVGLGLVFQLLYWLQFFGEREQVGNFLVLLLVRELAPILVGLIVLGRSGAVMLVELGTLKVGGQARMLDAMGVDPFLILLLPRVLATSLVCFCLNIAFVVSALVVGFISDHALGISVITIIEFMDTVLEAMGPPEFAIMLCKPLFIGFGVALISCSTGLMISGSQKDIMASMPGAFVRAVIVIFMFSGLFSLVF
jgi:phospholipid/cholesterol/gamma-HCH transport system permease protein